MTRRRVCWLAAAAFALLGCGDSLDIVVGRSLGDGGGVAADAPDGEARECADQPEVISLAVADDHTCAVLSGGSLHCWGQNEFGQLGDGTTEPRSLPTLVDLPGAEEVVGGDNHTCARAGGALHCWGDNAQGQLGVGDNEPRAAPAPLGAEDFAAVAARFDFTCALTGGGALRCWGSNADGQLGLGLAAVGMDANAPADVGADDDWTAISAGETHACGIRAGGTLWCWGDNANGRLGNGDDQPAPAAVGTDRAWRAVSAGSSHTCAVATAGTLWCWGRNGTTAETDGARFLPEETANFDAPAQVGDRTDWREVTAGKRHTCALDADGVVHCWGRAVAAAGTAGAASMPEPVAVGSTFRSVAASTNHTCGIREGGTLQCWGDNADGQLGLGDTDARTAPTTVCIP